MKLTKYNMRAAHFARLVDTDPNYEVTGVARARAWSREHNPPDTPHVVNDDAAFYELGKRVLVEYTLSYSPRRVGGTLSYAEMDWAGYIIVNAGHIATAEAERFAVFRQRGETKKGGDI